MYTLKKTIMKSILQKRKKNQPFNYEQAESYTLPEGGDGTVNNSYYFSAHSQKKQESLYVRLGLRDDGSAEVWAFYMKDGNHYTHNKLIYTAKDSPLIVKKQGEDWIFKFNGNLTDDSGKDISSEMNCVYKSQSEAVDFFYHMPAERTATAMAQDKWTKEYFAGVQENNSVHYEQEGILRGTLKLGDKTIEIDLPCLRDHSYGRRVWDYMNNHLWLAAVDEKCMLNFSMVSYPSLSVLEMGHMHKNGENVSFITKAHYDRAQIITGNIPDKLTMELTIDGKTTTQVEINLLHSTEYIFGGGAYKFYEGIAQFNIGGTVCRGILEIGFNSDSSRYMNGKNIKKIRE